MGNKERGTWIHLVGIILMFGVLIVIGSEIVLPIVQRKKDLDLSFGTSFSKPKMTIDVNKSYEVKMTTNFGVVNIKMYSKSTPNNINNFIHLAQTNYYDLTKFHRLISDMLIQGGDKNTLKDDINSYGKGKANYLINDEINWESLGLSEEKKKLLTEAGYVSTPGLISQPLKRFSVAMANSGPNTNSTQFFIILAENDDARIESMNGYFTVIGEVTEGSDVLDRIAKVSVDDPTSNNPRPTEDIIIQKTEVIVK